jgi:cytochrome c553
VKRLLTAGMFASHHTRLLATLRIFIPIFLLGFCARIPAALAQQKSDTVAERVLACASCHGTQGQGTSDVYFPRLAGKPAGYLFHQLVAFRGKRRKYPPMNYLLEFQSNDSLNEMAAYFAAQHPPLPAAAIPVVSKDILERGKLLTAQGDPQRGIPACARCHGASFTGMDPAIPGLLGLRARYIAAQLGAWRYGTRVAIAPDCMQIVAGHLTELDVEAVAAWLSSLPAPADTSPAPQGALAMPLKCGSEPN